MEKTFYVRVTDRHAKIIVNDVPVTIEYEKDEEINNLIRVFVAKTLFENIYSLIGVKWGYSENENVRPYLYPFEPINIKLGQITWGFSDEREAKLAESLYVLANANGMTINHFQHVFPAVLRMIGHNSQWTKLS